MKLFHKTIIILLLCGQLLAGTTIINSFNAGELSPKLEGRTDISKYYSGCRTLENFLVLTYGGATRRPGTAFIAEVKTSSEVTRLIQFEFSTVQAYILEFGNLYIRFYRNGGQIESGNNPFEIVTTYLEADLFQLHFVQSADTMYIVHPDYPPRVLTRTGHTAWTITDVVFSRGPFLDENKGDITITPSSTTATVILTASAALFDTTNHVGALWQITHTAPGVTENGSFSNDPSEQNSSSVSVQLGRTFDLSTHGTWSGDIVLQRSFDSGVVWKDVRPVHYENDGNLQYTDEEIVADAIYRVHADAGAAGIDTGTVNFSFTARSFDVDGVVDITSVASATEATGIVTNTLGGTTATAVWAEGAWSLDEGYPSTVAFYEERICYAATTNNPQTVWMSHSDDWPNFLAGTLATDAIKYTIAADQVNAIRWMSPQEWLLLGTSGGEWKLGSGNIGQPITFEDRIAKRQSSYGVANIQPVMMNNAILYVQRQGRKVRELVYSFELDVWIAPDMTVLSEHITDGGITQIAFQKTPDPILWAVTAEGNLIGFTYNREQEVTAWHNHTFDGDVESVAVIPGSAEDEVWVIVERQIDSSTVRYVEQFQPRDWGDEQRDAWFVDSGLGYDGGAAKTITDITKANPAVVTSAGHGLADGTQVRITAVEGMTELNNRVYSIGTTATNTFQLRDASDSVDIDSTGFTAYTSGGEAEPAENSFVTIDHLEGEEVAMVGDGSFLGTDTVSLGTITLDDFYNTVRIGKNYTSRLLPMKLAAPGNQVQGRTKRVTKITARLFETSSAVVGDSWDDYDSFVFATLDDTFGEARPLFSGDRTVDFDGDYETDGNIYFQQLKPLPCTLTALIPEWEVYD